MAQLTSILCQLYFLALCITIKKCSEFALITGRTDEGYRTGYRLCGTGGWRVFFRLCNHVVCVDLNKEKVTRLTQGAIPIYEPGLEEIVQRNLKAQPSALYYRRLESGFRQ